MKRRDLFRAGLALGSVYAIARQPGMAAASGETKLTPPATGKIPVAFLISQGAVMIDFAGPWEVFQDVNIASRGSTDSDRAPFELYTVAASKKPIRTSGGMQVIPDYSFADAPRPKVIVIPAQSDDSPATLAWLRKVSETADVTMSVCTGAFVLAQTGLLDGHAATTHHGAYNAFEKRFPRVTLKRGARFVEGPKVATAGGLTSGIDLALRVVERYFGHDVAEQTAYQMEYQGQGWMDPSGAANSIYASHAIAAGHFEDPVCGMEVEPGGPSAEYQGKTYHFCSDHCKSQFTKSPEAILHPGRKKSM